MPGARSAPTANTMSAEAGGSNGAGSAAAGASTLVLLAVLGVCAAILLLVVLEKTGLPAHYATLLAGLLVAVAVGWVGAEARTTRLLQWHNCAYAVPAARNGMAIAATVLSAPLLISISGLFLAELQLGSVFVAGPLLGLALLSVLVAPYLYRAGTSSIGTFLQHRFPSRWLGIVMMSAVASCCFLVLWTQVRAGVLILDLLLPFDEAAASAVIVSLIAVAVIPGGLQGVTNVNLVLYVLAAVAFLGPLVWLSSVATAIPVPQLAAGYAAMAETAALEGQLATLGIPAISGRIDTGWLDTPGFSAMIVFCLFIAFGVLALPAVLCSFQTTARAADTRMSSVWALFCVAAVVTAAPAAAAFARLGIYETLLGTTVGDLDVSGGWLLDWSSRHSIMWPQQPLVTLCGQAVGDVQAAVAACGGNPDYAIGPADLRLHGELAALALPQIAGLPISLVVVAGLGLVAAVLSTANALVFAVATSLIEDGVSVLGLERPRETLRLFAARIAALFVLIAMVYVSGLHVSPAAPALWGFAISAAAIAPVMLLSIWWRGLTASGAIAGVAVPGAILLAWFLLGMTGTLPGAELLATAGLAELPDPVVAAAIAFPAAFAAALIASLPGGAEKGRPLMIVLQEKRPEDVAW
jgi:cation/acetate symporter